MCSLESLDMLYIMFQLIICRQMQDLHRSEDVRCYSFDSYSKFLQSTLTIIM